MRTKHDRVDTFSIQIRVLAGTQEDKKSEKGSIILSRAQEASLWFTSMRLEKAGYGLLSLLEFKNKSSCSQIQLQLKGCEIA